MTDDVEWLRNRPKGRAPLRLVWGPIWGDELCDHCGKPAEHVHHLVHDDGVDEDYAYSCDRHLTNVVTNLCLKYPGRVYFREAEPLPHRHVRPRRSV